MHTYLQEAKKVVGLRGVAADDRGLADLAGKRGTLTERAVLNGRREERRRVDLFPEIEPRAIQFKQVFPACTQIHLRRLVPVVLDVVEVELDDGPERVGHIAGAIAVGKEPVSIGDDGSRAQSRAICEALALVLSLRSRKVD